MAKFEIGNKAAEKWTEEEAIKAFDFLYSYATDTPPGEKTPLSIQECFISCNIPGRTFYYLIEKFPVLHSYKKQIDDAIISHINRQALEGEYNPTASIWRMKQLGERDTQYQEVNSTVKQTNVISLGKGKKPE